MPEKATRSKRLTPKPMSDTPEIERGENLSRRRLKFTKRELAFFFLTPFVISVFVWFFLFTIVSSKDIMRPVNIARFFEFNPPSFTNPFGATRDVASAYVYDPYQLILGFEDTEYVLVDLRSKKEFEIEHIRGAINLPVYEDISELKDFELDQNDFLKTFEDVTDPKNTYIIYGNTENSFYVKDALQMLRRAGKNAYRLGIGWNEWRHFRNLWIPESQWDTFNLDMYLDGTLQQQ